MSTLAQIVAAVAVLWLSIEFFTTFANTQLGICAFGLFLFFIYTTIFELLVEVGIISDSEGEDEADT